MNKKIDAKTACIELVRLNNNLAMDKLELLKGEIFARIISTLLFSFGIYIDIDNRFSFEKPCIKQKAKTEMFFDKDICKILNCDEYEYCRKTDELLNIINSDFDNIFSKISKN